MEAITIRAVAGEVEKLCVPTRVGGVWQSSALEIFLELRGGGEKFLVLSVRSESPSFHLAPRRPPTLPSPTAFCRLLRKRLAGLVMTAVEKRGLERAVHLLFGATASAPPLYRLAVEIMGRWSNVVLVEEPAGVIVDSLQRVDDDMSSLRTILPGQQYLPPPRGGRVDPTMVEREEFLNVCRSAAAGGRALTEVFIGLGKGLQALAGVEEASRNAEGACEALHDRIMDLVARVDAGRTSPLLYPRRRVVLPLPAAPWAGEETVAFASTSAAAAHLFEEAAGSEERRVLESAARRAASRLRKRLRKALHRIEGEAEGADEEARLREAAGAILTGLDGIPRGAARFSWTDAEGVRKSVDLNPALSTRRNAEALFRRVRKVRRRTGMAKKKLPAARAELKKVEEHLDGLPALSVSELRHLGTGRLTKAAAGRKGGTGRRPPVREYRRGDWRILVGKSSRGNDELTSKIAKPDDCWLHTRDYGGAHVVIKGDGEPPEDVIRSAGEAAAWHSAARGEGLVDVAFTKRKYVRKVKGQAPGQVIVSQSKTVRVRPRVPEGFDEVPTGVIK